MVPRCATFADIGTDHGYLPLYLFRQGKIDRAYLTDISAPSLAKAKAAMERFGYSGRCVFSVGDGFSALDIFPEAAAIAGMGGALICEILSAGISKIRYSRLILQPNVDAPIVRKALTELGFRILDEAIAREGGRHYVVLAAEAGSALYTERELEIGPILLKKGSPHMKSYIAFRVRVLEKALKGAEGADDAAAEALKKALALWKTEEKRT
jgi:tRNA (adenine22-N1)-methyltransferase